MVNSNCNSQCSSGRFGLSCRSDETFLVFWWSSWGHSSSKVDGSGVCKAETSEEVGVFTGETTTHKLLYQLRHYSARRHLYVKLCCMFWIKILNLDQWNSLLSIKQKNRLDLVLLCRKRRCCVAKNWRKLSKEHETFTMMSKNDEENLNSRGSLGLSDYLRGEITKIPKT